MLSSPSSFIKYLITECVQSENFDFISCAVTFLETIFPNIEVVVIGHNNSPDCFQVKNTDTSAIKYKRQLESADRNDFVKKETFYELNELFITPLGDIEKNVDNLLISPRSQAYKYRDFFIHCAQIQDVYNLIRLNRTRQSLHEREHSAHLISQMSHDINSLLNLIPEECLQDKRFKAKVEYTDKVSGEIVYYLREFRMDMISVSVKELFEGIANGFCFPEKTDFSLKFLDQFDFVVVDVELIDRALNAILANAVFAANIEGGIVSMTLKKRQNISPFIKNDWIEVSIENSGPGIPPEFLPEVSKPFFTTWKDFGCAGLGLPIAEKIIKAHNGELSIKSNSGTGTIATILLPLNDGNTKE